VAPPAYAAPRPLTWARASPHRGPRCPSPFSSDVFISASARRRWPLPFPHPRNCSEIYVPEQRAPPLRPPRCDGVVIRWSQTEFKTTMTTISIAEPSVKSLFIQMTDGGRGLASGTAIVAQSSKGPVLVTNWHNVSGLHLETRKPLSASGEVPDAVVIRHNRANALGQWVDRVEPLHENGRQRWIEHPQLGDKMDAVALPLRELSDVQLIPYTLGAGDPAIRCGPSDLVSVVGFPFGIQAGGSLAVWASGFVASEPDVDFNALPLFLVDCRTRPGQSGSAVISYRSGGMVGMEDGSAAAFSGPVTRFLGLYSGRINAQSDLGLVWKARALRELVDAI
jgi:hypothetical protein